MKRILLVTTISFLFGNKINAQKNESIDIEKKIDSMIQSYQLPNGPGISVTVVKNDKIIYEKQSGYANLEYNIPISDSSPFLIASISKQFTAFAALLLEEEGKLSFDDDIKKYLPELTNLPYKVSIRQLANHTNGFANTDELSFLIGKNSQDGFSQQEIVTLLLKQKQLNFIPGSQFQYNNSGYTLLAEIVQRVSGQSLSKFLKERIFIPLKMDHTLVFDNSSTLINNKVYSYRMTENRFELVPNNGSEIGASGIYTTSNDLNLWAMNFNNPIVGSKEIFKKMENPSYLNSGDQIPYGLGLEVKNHKGLEVIFHGGGDAGYRSYLLRVPKYNFSLVVMGNLESFNPLDFSYGILDLYLEKYQLKQENKNPPHYTSKDLNKWTGNYEIFPGSFFSLLTKNDTLYFKNFQTEELFPLPILAKDEFSFPYISNSKFIFSEKGNYWNFSDFKYSFKKVNSIIPNSDRIDLLDFTGIYYNDELGTSYKLIIKNEKLVATHSVNQDIELILLATDEFYSNQSFFGRLLFIRNDKNEIVGYTLSGQNLSNIIFKKVE